MIRALGRSIVATSTEIAKTKCKDGVVKLTCRRKKLQIMEGVCKVIRAKSRSQEMTRQALALQEFIGQEPKVSVKCLCLSHDGLAEKRGLQFWQA